MSELLQDKVANAEDLKQIRISVAASNVGISTSFLRGLLGFVLDFSAYSNWKDNFHVSVNGRYEKSTALAVDDFVKAESVNAIQDGTLSGIDLAPA